MSEPPAPPVSGARLTALLPGAALLRATPRLSRRRALLLSSVFFAIWLVLQILLGLSFFFFVAAITSADVTLFSKSDEAATTMTSATGCALAIGLALAVLAAVAVERRWGGPSLPALGLRHEGTWARELVVGAALGPLAFALVLAMELALGWATVEPGHINLGGVFLGAVGFTAVAINEEVAIRGFLLQVLGRAWSPAGALLMSSGIFALLHAPNPNASPQAVAFLVVAGVALASGYLATGRLWLPIAFHWSWNFAQGPLFGFPVSGLPGEGVLAVTPVGPDWATGGGFGPEAGLVGLIGELVSMAVILAWRWAGAGVAATLAVAALGLAGAGFLLVYAH